MFKFQEVSRYIQLIKHLDNRNMRHFLIGSHGNPLSIRIIIEGCVCVCATKEPFESPSNELVCSCVLFRRVRGYKDGIQHVSYYTHIQLDCEYILIISFTDITQWNHLQAYEISNKTFHSRLNRIPILYISKGHSLKFSSKNISLYFSKCFHISLLCYLFFLAHLCQREPCLHLDYRSLPWTPS